jgi:glycosyltransferase involved in cell wall biosynthesis
VRIALVAPVEEAVPPERYGGIEAVVHELAEGMAARGHEVTLLASADSRVHGSTLVALRPDALRSNPGYADGELLERSKAAAAETAARILRDLRPDIVHNHMWRLLRFRDRIASPMVTTVHYPLDDAHGRGGFAEAREGPYVSISLSQQRSAPHLCFVANVYNGVDVESFEPSFEQGGGLLFLGRLTQDKGVDLAIRVAQTLGMPLTIAAKLVDDERHYFDHSIWPFVDGVQIRYVGEVDQRTKRSLLRGARALLYPVRWSEPFGLAMVEAMACGTPVVAFNRGGVSEVVAHGRTGYVVDSLDAMIDAVGHVDRLSRRACREHVEERFTAAHMVDNYEQVYARCAAASRL